MFAKKRTRVFKHGAFWKMQVFQYGVWITLRDLYLTRAAARMAAKVERVN